MVAFGKLSCNQCPTVQGAVHSLTKTQAKRNRREEVIHSRPCNNSAAKGKNELKFFDHQPSVPYAAPFSVPSVRSERVLYLRTLYYHHARAPHSLNSYYAPKKKKLLLFPVT